MILKPHSPTVITDWAEQSLLGSFPGEDSRKFRALLKARDEDLKKRDIKFQSSPVAGVYLLAVPDRSGNVNDYFFARSGGPFYRLGTRRPIGSTVEESNSIEKEIVAHFSGDPEKTCPLGFDLPWLDVRYSDSGKWLNASDRKRLATTEARKFAVQVLGMASYSWRKKVEADLAAKRRQISARPFFRDLPKLKQAEILEEIKRKAFDRIRKGQERLRDNLSNLQIALRRRWRAGEVGAIRRLASHLEAGPLATMREAHQFDNSFYAWLVENPDPVVKARRQDFCRNYPMLIPFASSIRETSQALTQLIDEGQPLTAHRQLTRMLDALAGRLDKVLSPQTLLKFMSIRRNENSRHFNYMLTMSLRFLDLVPGNEWPRSLEELKTFNAIMKGLHHRGMGDAGPLIAKRVVEGVGGEWDKIIHQYSPLLKGTDTTKLERALEKLPDFAEAVIDRFIFPLQFVAGSTNAPLAGREKEAKKQAILCALPLHEIVALSEKWRQPEAKKRFSQALSKLGADPGFRARVPAAWLPLIDPVIIPASVQYKGRPLSGVRIEELCSSAAIAKEGVPSPDYAQDCLALTEKLTRHLMMIQDPQTGQRGFVLVTASYNNEKPVYLLEIGTNQRAMPNRLLDAGRWLLRRLASGKQPEASSLSSRRAVLEKMAQTGTERDIGCDIRNPATAAAYRALWAEFLPDPVQEMILRETAAEPDKPAEVERTEFTLYSLRRSPGFLTLVPGK